MAEQVAVKMANGQTQTPQEEEEEVASPAQLLLVPEPEEASHQEKDSLLVVPEAEPAPPNADSCLSPDAHDPVETEDHKAEEHVAELPDDLLPENEKKALQELKHLVQEALDNQELGVCAQQEPPSPTQQDKKTPPEAADPSSIADQPSPRTIAKTLLEDDGAKTLEAIEETIVARVHSSPKNQVHIWGVKLMEDSRTDVILLKFLRARDFKVKEAFTMIKNTLKWRKEFKIDELVDEDLGNELERVVFMHGHTKQGNPVCYNVYGEFQNRELYQKTFSDEDKRQRFLRWRIQFLEKSVRKLDFRAGGVSTILHVNDLNNSPGPNRWELRQATNQALHLLQDNYPEFVSKQVFINVPWWYLALSKMISPFLTQRSKSKFVVASPSRSTETLFKYIGCEQIPTQYGGLSKDGDFGFGDSVSEITVKPSGKHIVEFVVTQACFVSWEARVVGWEVSYGAEFVPSSEDGYTIIIQKNRRINEEVVICSRYKVCEPGKLLLTINNPTSRKKKLLYRFKTIMETTI